MARKCFLLTELSRKQRRLKETLGKLKILNQVVMKNILSTETETRCGFVKHYHGHLRSLGQGHKVAKLDAVQTVFVIFTRNMDNESCTDQRVHTRLKFVGRSTDRQTDRREWKDR